MALKEKAELVGGLGLFSYGRTEPIRIRWRLTSTGRLSLIVAAQIARAH